MAKKVNTCNFSEPLNSAASAKVQIDVGDGNLIIDGLSGSELNLASGALQYLENQGQPTRSLNMSGSQAVLTLKASGKGQPWIRLPWAACNGATEWLIHLNPNVSLDISAHTDGGNVSLDFAGLTVTRASADTGGGNLEVNLPDNRSCQSVTVKSGAGNVTVELPEGMPARIRATSGLGKVMIDAQFSKVDTQTYQSPDYETASAKVDVAASSGAGNVIIKARTAHLEPAAHLILDRASK